MVERLKYCLHQLILCGYELFHLWVVVGFVGLIVAGLTIALSVPRVRHLRDFFRKSITFLRSNRNPNYML
jgi:hypothetical protein